MSDQGSLVILQTQLEDRGKYKAIISNGGGTVSAETELHFFYESACRSRCLNGGDCRESHYCSCPSDYEGRYCENFVGITEATFAPPITRAEVDLLSATTEVPPVPSIQTPSTAGTYTFDKPTEVPEIDVNKPNFGSGSGFESGINPDSQTIGSGDADIWSGSGSGSGLGPRKDKIDGKDGADLVDDEDFNKQGAVGSTKLRRRRSLPPISTAKPERNWHVNHRQRHTFESVAEEAESSDKRVNAIKPLDEIDHVGEVGADLPVYEYWDLKDDRAAMLKFER